MKTTTINTEWEEYYKTLEAIRRVGAVNMWGAAPVLADMCAIDYALAKDILISWIENYDELSTMYNW